MTSKSRTIRRVVILIVAVLCGGGVELAFSSSAQAIVGRPLTPISYAGVARRTTRRAVAYGAVARPYAPVAPVVAAPVVVAPAPPPPPVVVW